MSEKNLWIWWMARFHRQSASRVVVFLLVLAAGLVGSPPASAQAPAESVLYSFTGSGGDGANPYAGLIMDSAGNLYGTTVFGGASSAGCNGSCGTVFELVNSSGNYTEKVLYSFMGYPGDGELSQAGLIMDLSGNLYGTTAFGGAFGSAGCNRDGSGCGTVFELVNSSGTYTEKVLYNFTGSGGDGMNPTAGLIMDRSGNLYGTTGYGGVLSAACNNGLGCGTVFELVNSSGTYTEKVLYSFTGSGGDGGAPVAGLIMDSLGNLYGTTQQGGASGDGIVFELVKSSGYTETILHSFTGSGGDGVASVGNLIMDRSGDLYGTTLVGGAFGEGTVFELVNSSGTYTEKVLYSFTGSGGDGANPYAGLIMDRSGNLYSTTGWGGAFGLGTAFKLVNSSGTYAEQVLYSFGSQAGDGAHPYGGLIMDSLGNLYSVTNDYGSEGFGNVFMLPALATTTTLTSSQNPAPVGDSILLTATVSGAAGTPPGTVTFAEGSVTLGTQTLTGGQATFLIADAAFLGVGSIPITAQYNPSGDYLASSATLSQSVNGVAQTGGSNTFSGNQTVSGSVAATSFLGNGSGLTGVNAATAVTITGTINDSQVNNLPMDLTNATTAAETYANSTFLPLAGGTLSGGLIGTSLNLSSGLIGTFASFSSGLSAGGVRLPPGGVANATQGVVSNPFDAVASVFNSNAGAAQSQLFRWQAEPVASSNNTASPAATLNLLYGANGATPAETGLSVNANGTINFAPGQSFPGTTVGISGVTAGTGLSGGGTNGNVTLSNTGLLSLNVGNGISSTGGQSPTLSLNTSYTNTLYLPLSGGTLTGGLTATSFSGSGAGLTALNPANLGAGTAGINITGNATSATTAAIATTASTATNAAELGGVAAADYARLNIANSFTGNQSVTGNVSVSGTVTIGSGGTPVNQHLSTLFNPSFPALKSYACSTATVTIAGALEGSSIALGLLPTRLAGGGNIIYQSWVSATNTVTVEACNLSPQSQTAAGSGSIRIDLWIY